MLKITIYESPTDDTPVVFENINYVSYVSGNTYGPPALVAPAKAADKPTAKVDETVLYINTGMIPLWEIVRTADGNHNA